MPRAKKRNTQGAANTLRIAMPAWEIGRFNSGLGAKVGGLGVIVEELPGELVKVAAKQGIDLEIEILSPCFGYHDRAKLTRLKQRMPVTVDGDTFELELYEHVFPDGQKVVYFWDDWKLGWTTPDSIYPSDAHLALKLYSAVCQAMAGYIRHGRFDTIHLHDYHVGLIPFYLGDEYLRRVPVHFTIHNATYQGLADVINGQGYGMLDALNLPGSRLFHTYFDFVNRLNPMKACMLKVHENGGKITTVSGDIAGTWGYAAELRMSAEALRQRAFEQKGSPPGQVFVPNGYLDLFEKLPIAGITNGMSDHNRPDQLPELHADVLAAIQAERGDTKPIFRHSVTQQAMLSCDHTFDVERLDVKAELKRLLHVEAFGSEPYLDPIVLTAVGRLVDQKNFGLVADIVERTLLFDQGAKFIILASANRNDVAGLALEARFFQLAELHPDRVYFNNSFNLPLSKLIFAGGDFSLIPSRFEPCGLVDYEASLLGNIVIGRATGGLTKVAHCAYLYEWLDISDPVGEANAFFDQIQKAIETYRHNSARHSELMRTAMAIDAGWDTSALQYLNMYQYGLLNKQWYAARRTCLEKFTADLRGQRRIFTEFFLPGNPDYSDDFDRELYQTLHDSAVE